MRRGQIEEPISRAAIWAPRLAAFAIALAALAAGASRLGRLAPFSALTLFAVAVIVAGAAILCAIAAYGVIWRRGYRGAARATLGLLLALGLLAWPVVLSLRAASLPPVVDVSTDADDPPDFSRSARAWAARKERAPPDEPAQRLRDEVARAYPDLQPIVLDVEPDVAFKLVEKVAAGLRWTSVAARPPGGRLGAAHLDYVDRSMFFGFPADIAIRLTPLAGQTRVDLRSVERVGGHDIGAGARRQRAFAEALAAASGG